MRGGNGEGMAAYPRCADREPYEQEDGLIIT